MGIEDKFENGLKRFIEKDPERRDLRNKLDEEGVSKAETFRQVSGGLGKGKSHGSGKPEGKH